MKLQTNRNLVAAFLIAGLSACSTPGDRDADALREQLKAEETRNASLQASVNTLEEDVQSRDGKIKSYESMLAESPKGGLLPPNAKPGGCYARVFTPAQFETVTKRVVKSEASEKVVVKPAKFEWVEESVLVKAASQKVEVVPAQYDWVEEKVLVKQASQDLVPIPAVYKDVTEKVLVRPASTTWKKGRGLIEKVDFATGEIMCLVETPAEYKFVTKKVLASPAGTQKQAIPAEYRKVRSQVMVKPPQTRTIEIPAVYKTVRVKKMVTPATEQRVTVPAAYQTVTEQKMVADGRLQWRPVLCETNTTPDVVRRLQSALDGAGYNPGPIDGIIGPLTTKAMSAYQRSTGLASGQVTLETLKKLSVIN
jgi:hypothetical protein